MSSTNLIYDTRAYEKKLNASVAVGNYNMYAGQFENNSKCRSAFGEFSNYGVSLYNGNIVDLESDLIGITRRASLCPSKKFNPQCIGYPNCGQNGIPCSCPEYTSRNLINAPTCPPMFDRPKAVKAPAFATPSPVDTQQSLFDRFLAWFS